jgi:O-antigen biosynthesis protein
MRVAFVVPNLSPSGGTRVVAGHARRLAEEHGIDADVVATDGDLTAARKRRYDVVIATWWATAEAVYALDAARRVVFLQSLEYQWYRRAEAADALPASLVLSLPLHYVAVSAGLAAEFERLRPDAACPVVPNGVDKDVFTPRDPERPGGPLRVLVEGQPTIWLKGVEDAVRAVRAMSEPAHLTVAALHADATDRLDADDVRVGLTSEEMAELYRSSDVVLKLSRVEGLGLPAIEAMHCGVPCVVTPFAGHSDYMRHGENGVVVGFDDLPGATAWLDTLARGAALRERLRRGALETAAGWPSPHESTARLAGVLEEIHAAPEPAADPAIAGVLARVRLASELTRMREGELRWHEDALEGARRHVHELAVEFDGLVGVLEREHDALNGSPLYRVLRRARRAARIDPAWP